MGPARTFDPNLTAIGPLAPGRMVKQDQRQANSKMTQITHTPILLLPPNSPCHIAAVPDSLSQTRLTVSSSQECPK